MTRDEIAHQALGARSLEEVLQARLDLRAWQGEHPAERVLHECFDTLATLEDCYRSIAAEEAAMTEEERVHTRARRALYRLAHSPWSLADVEEAERGLHLWLCEHPDDEEMRGLYPALAMYREMYEILAQDDATSEGATRRGAALPELAAR